MQVTLRLAIGAADPGARTPTVLVMSDDADWRAAVRRVLEQEGYRVLAARHPGQALVQCMRHDGQIDLLLTDGDQGQRRTDFPGIFRDHPRAQLLLLRARPATREDLVAAIRATTTP